MNWAIGASAWIPIISAPVSKIGVWIAGPSLTKSITINIGKLHLNDNEPARYNTAHYILFTSLEILKGLVACS